VSVFGHELVGGEASGTDEADYPKGEDGICEVKGHPFWTQAGEAIVMVHHCWSSVSAGIGAWKNRQYSRKRSHSATVECRHGLWWMMMLWT
jgi:hypothetical protein